MRFVQPLRLLLHRGGTGLALAAAAVALGAIALDVSAARHLESLRRPPEIAFVETLPVAPPATLRFVFDGVRQGSREWHTAGGRYNVSGSELLLHGWAYDAGSALPLSAAVAYVDGRSVPCIYGSPRPDVAAQLANPSLTGIGWYAHFPAGTLPRGRHRIVLGFVTSDRAHVALARNEIVLDVR